MFWNQVSNNYFKADFSRVKGAGLNLWAMKFSLYLENTTNIESVSFPHPHDMLGVITSMAVSVPIQSLPLLWSLLLRI